MKTEEGSQQAVEIYLDFGKLDVLVSGRLVAAGPGQVGSVPTFFFFFLMDFFSSFFETFLIFLIK